VGVTRRIIFPSVRIVLWAVIAVALVKMAFTGTDITAPPDALHPTAQVVDARVAATAGTVTNTVTVKGAVAADPAIPVKATLAGTVTKLLAEDGQAVDVGTPILVITQEQPVDPTVATDPTTGAQTVTANKPSVKTETIKAPHAGTLALPTLKDQIVAVGDAVGSVSPGTMSVSGTLTADQQYRMIGPPTQAQVTLKGGPAPFTCTNLRIGAASPSTGSDTGGSAGGAGQVADGGSAQAASGVATCSVPPGVTAFPGLGADMAVTNGSAENAVVVPVTAVQGSVQKGNVWIVRADGGTEERPVTLGLTDGENVQIVDGIALGDQILQFVPVGDGGIPNCHDPEKFDAAACQG
jgi:biotin carboxyl carrier protein